MAAPWIMRKMIQWKFKMTSLEQGKAQIIEYKSAYVDLLNGLTDEQACQRVKVNKMLGVDDDMREWSLCEIIEHNTIVNKVLKERVLTLLTGENSPKYEDFDIKRDVMPGLAEPFRKAEINQFVESVDAYLDFIATYSSLKTSATAEHPIFGIFNAHQFHIMFSFHLGLHLKQAQAVVDLLD